MGELLDLSKLHDPRVPLQATQPQPIQIQLDPNGQVLVSEQELQFYLAPIHEKLDKILELMAVNITN